MPLYETGIDGVPLEDGTPEDGETIQYNAAGDEWQYVTIGVPAATAVGQVLISLDGSTFTAALPVIDDLSGAWIADDFGELVVEG